MKAAHRDGFRTGRAPVKTKTGSCQPQANMMWPGAVAAPMHGFQRVQPLQGRATPVQLQTVIRVRRAPFVFRGSPRPCHEDLAGKSAFCIRRQPGGAAQAVSKATLPGSISAAVSLPVA